MSIIWTRIVGATTATFMAAYLLRKIQQVHATYKNNRDYNFCYQLAKYASITIATITCIANTDMYTIHDIFSKVGIKYLDDRYLSDAYLRYHPRK